MIRWVVVRRNMWPFVAPGNTPAPSIAVICSVGGETKTVDEDPLGDFNHPLLLARRKLDGTHFRIQLLDIVAMGKQHSGLI